MQSGGTASRQRNIDGGTEYPYSPAAPAMDVSFAGAGGLLKLDQALGLSGTISGWAVGDTIDFVSATVTSAVISGTTLTVTEAGNQTSSPIN